MTDLIDLAKGKLNDPILMEWALDRYRDTEKGGGQIREAMEQAWFDDLTLRRWLDTDDKDILTSLFSQLPPARFANLGQAIGERWGKWKGTLAYNSAPVLARYQPDLALKCFLEPQGGRHPDTDTVVGIIRGLLFLPREDGQALLKAIFDQTLKSKDSFTRNLLLGDLLSVGLELDRDIVLEVTRTQLRDAKEERTLDQTMSRASLGLFGNSIYLKLASEIRSGVTTQRFQQLAPFFREDAPLEQLDQWSSEQPSLSDLTSLAVTFLDEQDRILIFATVEMLKGKGGAKRREKIADFLVGSIAAACERKDLNVEGMGLQETVDLLAADLSELRHFELLLNRLRDFNADDVVSLLMEALEREKATYGSVHIAEIMGQLGWDMFVPPLTGAMCHECGDFLCEAARDALALIGNKAQEHLISHWETLDSSQRIYGLSVILAIGGESAASFAIDRYDDLMADDPEYWFRLASAVPDRRLLKLLESQLPRQQGLIDETFYPLARLLDIDHPQLDAVRERIHERKVEQQARIAAFDRGNWFQDSLNLALRCSECGDVNEYKVRKIAINPVAPNSDIHLAQEFACASCGTWADFEFTSEAKLTVTAELVTLAADSDAGLAGKSNVLARIEAPLNGKAFPVGEVISRCNAAVDKDSTSIPHWLRLGFCYHTVLWRPRFALKYAEQALSLESNAVEAVIQKADGLAMEGENKQAFDLLDHALATKDHWRFFLTDVTTPAQLAAQFAQLYNELLRRLGRTDRANLLASFLGASKKVGRNDPCPCGSGKKYKKCCLLKS